MAGGQHNYKGFSERIAHQIAPKTMPYYQVKGTQNEIYNQILDILRRD